MQKINSAIYDTGMKTERNKAMVEAYLTGEKTYVDISKEFGVCRERVRQIIDRYKENDQIYG